MKRHFFVILLFFFCIAFTSPLFASPLLYEREIGNLDFSVIRKGSETGLKILIIGGIQGDEPGGFSAASLLSTHYNFYNAQIILVPNLNFDSIIKRSRGAQGDMNRKFATLSMKDPQYDEVRRLQQLIRDENPDIVLNLHDGSGFYSPSFVSSNRNSNRWGQSIIIDKDVIASSYGDLNVLAEQVRKSVNSKIQNEEHHFTVNNTHTDKGNPEMEKTLTWFAINLGNAAFGLEVSKEFNVPLRTMFHLQLVEGFLDTLYVDYERSFPLTSQGVNAALSSDVYVNMAEGRITLPLDNLRTQLAGYFPMPKPSTMASPQPIVALVDNKKNISVHYGNNILSNFRTELCTLTPVPPVLAITADNNNYAIKMGETVYVSQFFEIEHQEGLRINVIGADLAQLSSDKILTEAGVRITKKDFNKKYSLDKAANIYRVEAYQGKHFAGMFLVDFSSELQIKTANAPTLPSNVKAEPHSLTGR